MPQQFMNAPSPSQGEFSTLSASVTQLSEQMANDSTSYANNKLYVAKRSGIVTLYIAGYSGTGNVTIATLDAKYRPWRALNGLVSTGSKTSFVEIGTDGSVKMYSIASTDTWYGTFSYVANTL